MTTMELTGLSGEAAHGFLATLGLLEATRDSGLEARLAWDGDLFRPRPAITINGTEQDLIDAVLADCKATLVGPVLNFPPGEGFPTLKCEPAQLASWASAIDSDSTRSADADLWCGLVVEGGMDNGGRSKPTHFDFSAGQMKFLKSVRELGSAMNEAYLREAIFGPWTFDSALPVLNFEKEGERIQALRAVPPADEKKKGVPGADWLAFRALAFYPLTLIPGRDRPRVVTSACDVNWNASAFRWPIWSEQLDRRTVTALVTDPRLVGEHESQRETDPEILQARGIRSIRVQPIRRSSQGYGSFGPPRTLAYASNSRLSASLAN